MEDEGFGARQKPNRMFCICMRKIDLDSNEWDRQIHFQSSTTKLLLIVSSSTTSISNLPSLSVSSSPILLFTLVCPPHSLFAVSEIERLERVSVQEMMMKGYSKMTTSRSRSVDLSDWSDVSFTDRPTTNLNNQRASGLEEAQEEQIGRIIKTTDPSEDPGELLQQSVSDQYDDKPYSLSEKENIFEGEVVLSRSYSSVPSKGFEKPSLRAQCSATKRGFSMRRSSSVSESYSRIHDQSMTLTSQIDEEDEYGADTIPGGPIIKKKNKGGKIFKACKRIFGL